MRTWHTPAKINLFLNIRGKRHDGYHEVVTVMQTVRLSDRITVEPLGPGEAIELSVNHKTLQSDWQANSMVSAYRQFWRVTGKPPIRLRVHLEKQIPVQAGMGGGSSDAAAMIRILSQMVGACSDISEQEALAAALGSDTPFFLHGGTALAVGRGEKVTSLETSWQPFPLLVVKPKGLNVSTPAAYQAYEKRGIYESSDPSTLLALLTSPSVTVNTLTPHLFNDFETVIDEIYPELRQIRSSMNHLGIERPFLSGSGPTLVGFLPDPPNPGFHARLTSLFPEAVYETHLTQTCPHGLSPDCLS